MLLLLFYARNYHTLTVSVTRKHRINTASTNVTCFIAPEQRIQSDFTNIFATFSHNIMYLCLKWIKNISRWHGGSRLIVWRLFSAYRSGKFNIINRCSARDISHITARKTIEPKITPFQTGEIDEGVLMSTVNHRLNRLRYMFLAEG